MSKELIEILDNCIGLVSEKKETIENCLQRHKKHRAELEPLLLAALRLENEPPATPSSHFKQLARQRLVAAAKAKQASPASSFSLLFKKKWPAGVVRRLAYQVAAAALALVLLGGTATASAQSLPGSPLYPLKLAGENARLALIWNKEAQAEFKLEMGERRFGEAERLIHKREYRRADWALSEAFKHSEEAEKLAEELPAKKKAAILAKLIQISQRQQGVLEKVFGQVPTQAKSAIARALEASRRGLEKASSALQKTSGKEEKEEKIRKQQGRKDSPEKPSKQITPQPEPTLERNGSGSGSGSGSGDEQHEQMENHDSKRN